MNSPPWEVIGSSSSTSSIHGIINILVIPINQVPGLIQILALVSIALIAIGVLRIKLTSSTKKHRYFLSQKPIQR